MKPYRSFRDPYGIFQNSCSPPGLYARQKWLEESDTEHWKRDFSATVKQLYDGQASEGLWNDSSIETVRRLFGLHLTVRTASQPIQQALRSLLSLPPEMHLASAGDLISEEQLRGLPFVPTKSKAIVLPATLFLATIFDLASDPEVQRLYAAAAGDVLASQLTHMNPAGLSNILRALVVHPDFVDHAATRSVVDWLSDRQTPKGDWGHDVPFYQTLNALAHLNLPSANRQTERGFACLAKHQQDDGAWGEQDRLWCTFLAVHALRNKSVL